MDVPFSLAPGFHFSHRVFFLFFPDMQIKQAIDDVKEMLRLDEGNKAGLALLEELKKAGGSV